MYSTYIRILIFILLVSVVSVSAQKKQVFLNGNLENISKEEFMTNNAFEEYLRLTYDLDSVEAKIKVKRIEKGKLANTTFQAIKTLLEGQSDVKIGSKDRIIINYYPGKDDCNAYGNITLRKKNYRKYIKKAGKLKNTLQFNVYKSLEGIENLGYDLKWIPDESRRIEIQFIPLHYPCGSFILINPEGNYYSYKGEYNLEKIFELIEEENTFQIH